MDKSDLKNTFLELLNNDANFRREIKQMIKPEKVKFSTNDRNDINSVRNYWNEVSRVKNNGLYSNEKTDILNAIIKHGKQSVFDAIDKVVSSPLMTGNNPYKQHLQNLGWCMKPHNIEKIMNGVYDGKKVERVNNNFDNNIDGYD